MSKHDEWREQVQVFSDLARFQIQSLCAGRWTCSSTVDDPATKDPDTFGEFSFDQTAYHPADLQGALPLPMGWC